MPRSAPSDALPRDRWFINGVFSRVWLSQAVSQLGDAVIEVTLPVWVGILTNEPIQVAGVAAAELLPGLILGPIAGVFVDQWNPRLVVLICDALRLLLVLSLVAVPTSATLPAIYGVTVAVACTTAFFNPAKNILATTVVQRDEIPRAQALAQATQSLALIAGPAIGAALLGTVGLRPGLMLDAVSFGLAASMLIITPVGPPARMIEESTSSHARSDLPSVFGSTIHHLRKGLLLIIRTSQLRILLLVAASTSLVGYLWFAVDVFFVQQSLHMPKGAVGFLWAASGAGGLVSSSLIAVFAARVPQHQVLVWGLGIRGLALLWYSSMGSYPLAVPAAFLAGAGDGLLMVALGSLIMTGSPQTALGRVTAIFGATGQASALGAIAILAFAQARLSPALLLQCCGVLLCLTTLASWRLVPGRERKRGSSGSELEQREQRD